MAFGQGLLFTFRQKRGILVFFLLVLLIIGLSYGVARFQSSRAAAISEAQLTYLPPIFEQDTFSLDINLADSSAWAALPGIGPSLSRRIVRYRSAIGGFHDIDQLSRVYGLDSQALARIRPFLFVNAITAPAPKAKPASRFADAPATPARPPRLELNQASAAELSQLPGIGPVLSARIVKYREAIGGYDSTAQLARIYGLPPETYTAILPYLYLDVPQVVAETEKPALEIRDLGDPAATNLRVASPSRGAETLAVIDLNSADSAQLVALPGIGAVLSSRILKYRRKMGFFYSVEQLRMIYGLSEENFQRMAPYLQAEIPAGVAKHDLNTIGQRDLRFFPHIGDEGAEALLAYRRQLGRFTAWDEVARTPGLAPEALSVLRAYFTF